LHEKIVDKKEYYMLDALKLAQNRKGFCAPNPAVGAVIVKNQQIISTGYHYAAGFPHAEAEALKSLERSDLQDGASLYVTLEPCCHWGKTPPCTQLIIQHGIKEVFYGLQDPNSKVAGKGIAELAAAGIKCELVHLLEIEDFYKSYKYWTDYQLPLVTAKLAISLDAKIADPSQQPLQITGSKAQQYTHRWRCQSDAILTTAKTIIHDNPSLNARHQNEITAKPLYVIDSDLSFPISSKVMQTAKQVTLFHKEKICVDRKKQLETLGVQCHPVAADNKQGLNLLQVMQKIGADGIHDLWVEAGGILFSALIQCKLVHKSLVYIAPKVLGHTAYSAFATLDQDIFAKAKNVCWYPMGLDTVCELDW
jgi:diaminohydroxyphosphoribosylaminopyrimidine deaminase / 5-amino-6-(5-phosphoribosylamino)uracil reductase